MQANIGYVLSVFLKKEIALKSDEIAERIDNLIRNHFHSHLSDENKLDTTQISRFTGIAYSSDNTTNLRLFIEHQAEKERRAKGKKPWTAKSLDKNLLNQIKEITTTDSKQVYEAALDKGRESMGNVVDEFDQENKKILTLDVSIELLKRFATHFGIHYLYKGG